MLNLLLLLKTVKGLKVQPNIDKNLEKSILAGKGTAYVEAASLIEKDLQEFG